jgi:hypothetical protein
LIASRTLATLGLLGLLVWRVDLGTLRGSLAGAAWPLVLLSCGVIFVRNVTQAWRWQATLRAWGEHVPMRALLRMVLASHLFTLILPTSAGGDLARWSLLARQGAGGAVAGQSVLADRLLGLVGLGLLLLAALPWGWEALPGGVLRAGPMLVVPVTGVVLFAVLEPRWLPHWLRARLQVAAARRHRWVLAATGASVLNHVVAVAAIVLLGRAVGDTTGPGVYATLLPLVWLLSMLPVAIGGLGVREAGFVALFGAAGMPTVQATAIAGLWLGLTLGQALVGGLVLLASRRGAARSVSAAAGPPPPASHPSDDRGHAGSAPARPA